jgi:hypothetical protein
MSSDEEEESSMDSPHTGALDAAKKRRQSPRFQQQQQQQQQQRQTTSTAKRALPLTSRAAAGASKKQKGGATGGKPPLAKKKTTKGALKVKKEAEVPKTKQARFNPVEDLCLTKAWISASEDPVVGANRKGTAFWQCVKTKFDILYELEAEVMQMFDYKSLSNRWMRHINKDVQLFLKYWKAATENPPSGTTESDWMTTATDNYLHELGSVFRFPDCFRILKESPKFCIESNAEAQALANEEGRNSTEIAMAGSLQRPIGSKAAKKLKSISSSSVASATGSSIDQMTAVQREISNTLKLKDDRKTWFGLANVCLQMGDTAGAKMWVDMIAATAKPTTSPAIASAAASPTVVGTTIAFNEGNAFNEDNALPPLGTKTTGLDEDNEDTSSS